MAAPTVPPFEPLNDLERLLVRAATEPDQRPAFTKALLEADLFAVTPDGGPLGSWVAGEGESVSLAAVQLDDGALATAVFSAPERAGQVYGPDAYCIGMKGRDLLGAVAERPVLLNSGLAYGVLWSTEDLAGMLGRPVSRSLGANTPVMLSSPSRRPDALVMALAEAFHPEPGVKAAWLALAHWPDQDEVAWYFDVRSSLPHDRLNALLTRAMEGGALKAGQVLDMTIQPPGGAPGTGIAVVAPRT